jgi:polar amino acid transport system substrate-binding protein
MKRDNMVKPALNALGLALLIVAATGIRARADEARDIAPTGALRVAIAVGPAPSTFWATRDPATGKPRGVTVDLGKAAADKLHVPLQLVEYPNSGEIAAASDKGAWDISFMPADAEREKFVDQGPAYVVYASGYLVRAGSEIRDFDEVDRAGVRIGCIDGTATSRTLARTLKNASLTKFPEASDAAERIGKGDIDALSMGVEALEDLQKKLPGTRVLDGIVQSTGVVVTVPKNRPATREWAAHFVEDSKTDGTVRHAFDNNGFGNVKVAP